MPAQTEEPREAAKGEQPMRTWRPSRRPEHLQPPAPSGALPKIVEHQHGPGVIGAISAWLRLPLVRVMIGIALLIAGAIVFDQTVDGGAWTERQDKRKPGGQLRPQRPASDF